MLKGLAMVACALSVSASVFTSLPRGAEAARIPSLAEWEDNSDFDFTGSIEERTLLSRDYNFGEVPGPLSATHYSFELDYSDLSRGFETFDTTGIGSSETGSLSDDSGLDAAR